MGDSKPPPKKIKRKINKINLNYFDKIIQGQKYNNKR